MNRVGHPGSVRGDRQPRLTTRVLVLPDKSGPGPSEELFLESDHVPVVAEFGIP